MVPSVSTRTWSSIASWNHHTSTTMSDCWYDVLFMKCYASLMQGFQKVVLMSHQSTEYFLKSFGMFFGGCFLANARQAYVFLLISSKLTHGCYFFPQSLSYCWIMNTDLIGTFQLPHTLGDRTQEGCYSRVKINIKKNRIWFASQQGRAIPVSQTIQHNTCFL